MVAKRWCVRNISKLIEAGHNKNHVLRTAHSKTKNPMSFLPRHIICLAGGYFRSQYPKLLTYIYVGYSTGIVPVLYLISYVL